MVNIATNANQAEVAFFTKLKARLRSRCFEQFRAHIGKNIARFSRVPIGENQPTLLLQIHSLHAKAESWEGLSPLVVVMDEADAFEDRGEYSADKCFGTIISSARSRYNSRFLMMVISYRRVADGFMDRQIAEARLHPDTHVWDEATTYEVLPWKKRVDFQADYDRDEEQAMCWYENKAPAAMGALIRDGSRIDACLANRSAVAFTVPIITHKPGGTGERQSFIGLELSNLRPETDATYFLHCDAGSVNASFAVGMCHLETKSGFARGHDNQIDPAYQGDTFVDGTGRPLQGITVIYRDKADREVGRTITDDRGRHSLWLPVGIYRYSFHDVLPVSPEGLLFCLEEVKRPYHVQAGVPHQVYTGDTGPDGELLIHEKVVYPIVEDLLLEWRPAPGYPVDYENVEKVLLQLCYSFNIDSVTFDQYQSAHLIQTLCTKGINAIALPFGRSQQMAIYKNFRSLINSGLWNGLNDGVTAERANTQVRQLRLRGEKIEAGSGFKDLADARAVSAFYASRYAVSVARLETDMEDEFSERHRAHLLPGRNGQWPVASASTPMPAAAYNRRRQSGARGFGIVVSDTILLYEPGCVPGVDDCGESPIARGVPYR